MLTKDKINYRRNILISIIISEVLIISAFIFSPKKSIREENIIYDEPLIHFNDIPQTIQGKLLQIKKPVAPPVYISDEIEAFKPLGDVGFSSTVSDQNSPASAEFPGESTAKSVRTVPRQIFEVVPAAGEDEFNGRLQLSLRINDRGQVIDHRVLFNSLDCTDCLNDIIKAAYRSKWEPAVVNGKNSDYWVVKSYVFN